MPKESKTFAITGFRQTWKTWRKIAFFVKLRKNLENSWDFREFFKILGKLRENLTL